MKVARRVSMCVLLLIPVSLAWAQDDPANRREERRQERREDRAGQPVTASRDTSSDSVSQQVISEFATLLAIKNQEEVELSRWAGEKTQNDEVRQFAQKLVEDHTKFISELQQFNPSMELARFDSESGQTPTSQRATNRANRREERREERGEERREGNEPDRAQPNQDQNPNQDQGQDQTAGQERRDNRREGREDAAASGTDTQVTTRTAAPGEQGAAGQGIHLRVAHETARRCLEMTKEKLGSKQGEDFDRCFIGGQIVAHVGMIAKLQAQQQFASAEYSQVLEKGIQSSQEHLKHAEMLAQKLEGHSGQSKAGNTGAARDRQPKPNEGAAGNQGAAGNREENPNQ